MAEKWGVDKAKPEAVGPPRRGLSRAQRARKSRNDRKRRATRSLSLAVLIVVVIGAVFLGSKLWHSMSGGGNDYAGDGVADVVIQVHDGDSTTAIAKTLQDHKVVATVKAFVDAAGDNDAISAIQPGFYKLRTEIPAANAVERLADPQSRVGKLTIPEGRQLDDTADVRTKAVTDGIFTLISHASCVELDGKQRCVSVDELRAAAQSAPAAALAVPDWAAGPVAAMPNDHRRLEGLIAPGTWNVDPAAPAQDILSTLIAGSAALYTQGGLLDTAAAMQMSPYQILTVGSLVQREAKPQDFDKVARVIYNRLAESRKLEFDSTVNYPLDRQEVATTDDDRAKTTPWNTYMRQGLPQTPICSPGTDALAAAEHPAAGDWLYFVTIDLQGTTLFTRDYDQHLANIELAQHNGVLDSARWRPAAVPDRRPAAEPDRPPRKAAVLGSPIAHSRSPQLHLAAYQALGLGDWTYERIECTAEQLPGLVGALGPEWVGLSVTMPGKFAALEFADQRTERAELVGSANTLVRIPSGGWRADNTDIDGVVGALGTAGDSALVIGSGGTAPAAVVALAELGVRRITIVARDAGKASRLVELAGRCGAQSSWCDIGSASLPDAVAAADSAVSTIPADAAAAYAGTLATVPRVLDAIYDPWPTPLAAAVQAAGGEAIDGLQMLLNQAFAQVEQFTGMAAPQEAMRAALL